MDESRGIGDDHADLWDGLDASTERPGRAGRRSGSGGSGERREGRRGSYRRRGPVDGLGVSADGLPIEGPLPPPKAEPQRDPGEVAREICLRQLAVRPRTRAELAAALAKRGVADEVAAEVLDVYDEVGIIDDQAFARAWVTSRHHGKGLARRALAGELRRKGVDNEAVAEALSEVDDGDEERTARELVARKLRLDRGTDPDATFRRLVGMLARKGYGAGTAIKVVKEAMAERAETAEYAGQVDPDAFE